MVQVYERCLRFVAVMVCAVVFGWAGWAPAAVLNSDADFGLQTVGNHLVAPWNWATSNSHTATVGAQSPFTNAFANNGIGANMGAIAGNPYFVGGFTEIPASATGYLYLNVDFRNNDASADAYTFAVTRNAGQANTLMLAVSGNSLLARSGAGWGSSILTPVVGAWYNVQLTLNLNNDTYSGVVTQFGGPTVPISSRSFINSNVGINTLFSDGGSDGSTGTAPSHEIDNFALMTTAPDARIVNIDFNGVRGGEPVGPTYVGSGAAGGSTVFNGLLADSRGSNGDNLTVSGSSLLDSNGIPTTFAFTVSPVGGDNPGGSPDPTSSAALFGDYIFDHSAGNGSDSPFTISGLGGAQADLYFYHTSGDATITVDGATASAFTPTGIFTAANTLYFARVPIVNNMITGHFGNGTAVINGLTIVASIPEPGTVVLLSLGGLGLLCWRRRRGGR